MKRSIELTTGEIAVYRAALDADRQDTGPHIPNNVYQAMFEVLKQRGRDGFPEEVTIEHGFPATVFRLHFSEAQNYER